MIKCFLSHSSQDKTRYIRDVAAKIKREAKVYDEETFEAGMSPVEEIARGLDESSLFVIFLSSAALASSWVKDELASAKDLFDNAQLERIYPIIIETGITFEDPRIPLWMRQSLNIQPILKPAIAARKINSRLTELAWKFHPRLKERQEIFVGRNDLVKQVEERLDDFSKPTPIVFFASGLASIGRKALMQHAVRKANLVRDSFEFPIISLSAFDSIEDFILKIYDLGFIAVENFRARLQLDLQEKISLAKEIMTEIASEKERIIIEDRGVIVLRNGHAVDWFAEVIDAVKDVQHLSLCVASQYRLKASYNRTHPEFYSMAVGEMEATERNGLLVRYSKFQELKLKPEEFEFFADILTGYPEQVLFAVDLVKELGIFGAKKVSHTIQQYGSDKAKVVLDNFKGNNEVLDFIYLLCRFEFISYDVLFDIIPEDKYFPMLEELLASSICERMGASADYVRVNEVVRDYVSRSRFGLPPIFDQAIKRHVSSFLERYEDENVDVSDYIFSAQEALKSGADMPEELIIPSVFLKTIRRIYDEGTNYAEAVLLCDRVLKNERYLHSSTIGHVRFIKCQCLARLRDNAFFTEVRHVSSPDKWFLHGFYYRLSGEHSKAEENLKKALEDSNGRRDPRTLGELILVYMQSDEYELALDLAKENYKGRSGNPINANNYFTCLIMRERSAENREVLDGILKRLKMDPSDRAQEMAASAEARLLAYYQFDEHNAFRLIDETIKKFPKRHYPILTKADLATHFKNRIKLKEAVDLLEKIISKNTQSHRTLIKYKAALLALSGDLHQAKQLVNRELRGMFGASLQRLQDRLEYLSQRNGNP